MTECSLCDQKKEECFCQNYWHSFEDDLWSIKFPENDFEQHKFKTFYYYSVF